MSLVLNITIFAACSLSVIIGGYNLARFGDILSEKTTLGAAWIGLIFIAAVTSLPELVTTVTGGTINAPQISIGNAFGSNMFNIAIIGIVDIVLLGGGPFLSKVHRYHIFSGAWSILLTLTALWGIIIPSKCTLYGVDLFSIIIIFLYLIGAWLFYRLEKKKTSKQEIQDLQSEKEALEEIYGDISVGSAVQGFIAMAGVIILAGVFLTKSGKNIANYTGLSGSFIGAIFVALSTSLPELATSIGALKVKAYDMIMGDIFGSNMFNIITVFFADLAFRQGSILKIADDNQILVATVAMTITIIAISSLNYRSDRKILGIGIDSLAILVVYCMGIFLLFQQGIKF